MRALNFSETKDVIEYISKNNNAGYLLFSTVENIKELSGCVDDNVVLCSTAGEYTPNGYENGVITGFQYDREECNIVEILYPPIKSIEKLKEAYSNVKSNPQSFLLLLCDGLSGMEESIITTLFFIDDKFKVIGGSAGDNLKFEKTLIYIGKKQVHSAALFFNSKARTQLIKENIYVPTGDSLLVTEADSMSRIVKTFNNKPASTEYARALGTKESELSNQFMNHPLGKVYKNDIFIASPMKINSDKSITFYCQIMPNSFVHVLKPIDPIIQIKDTLNTLAFKPDFIFAVNCILRSLKFRQENLWKDIDKEILKVCNNTTGFVSYGEQFYKNHCNQTMVILAVE
ncbi:MAG: hypothetical protein K0R54_1992 [Clostridiaceae bacterium]|jgi:hypothetical protein|nr:hypothetical protein [Clostridiaceae bacterium]